MMRARAAALHPPFVAYNDRTLLTRQIQLALREGDEMSTYSETGATFIEGQIFNARTGEAVAGAGVGLADHEFRTISIADGTYSVEIPNGLLPAGQYAMVAGQVGLAEGHATIMFYPGKNAVQDFTLEPRS